MYISSSRDVFKNLAIEEWALKELDTSHSNYLLLYIDKASVVLGRNQNLFEEINPSYCKKENIAVARRISGGGTVFHDEGNLNWTWITGFDEKKVNRYDWAAQPIIDLLESYGLQAYLTERNAIEVDGLKLSGQAQFTNRKNILSHGTLLISSELSKLQPAIEMDNRLKIESKARPSVRSQTTNLNALTGIRRTAEQCAQDLIDLVRGIEINLENTAADFNKFTSEEWIVGRSPRFRAAHTVDDELLELTVEKGIITAVKKKKDHLIDSPFLNQTYEKFLAHYS